MLCLMSDDLGGSRCREAWFCYLRVDVGSNVVGLIKSLMSSMPSRSGELILLRLLLFRPNGVGMA